MPTVRSRAARASTTRVRANLGARATLMQISVSLRALRRYDLHAGCGRHVHHQPAAGYLFDAGLHCPCTLFELQLPPLHLKLPRDLLLSLQLDIEFASLVLRRHYG